MVPRMVVTAVVAAGLVAAAGCGPAKLDETRTYSLDPGGDSGRALDLPAQPKPQTITVTYESAEPVGVGIYKAGDVGEGLFVQPAKALKAEAGKTAGTLTADVPENTATRVVVSVETKKTDVKLHVTNKK